MYVILALGLLFLTFFSGYAHANTEKTIFLAPPPIDLPSYSTRLANLPLANLTPDNSSLRTRLSVSFPTPHQPRGNTSVYLLGDLTPGQRYEVRVCWAATVCHISPHLVVSAHVSCQSPTDFTLVTHTLPEVFETPELIQVLTSYVDQLQESSLSGETLRTGETPESGSAAKQSNSRDATALFLYVEAAAAFYSSNQTLMRYPPPVLVDIILDPYLLNVFPRSLVPTAIYLIGLAVGSWYLSGFIWRWLSLVAQPKPHDD